MHEMDSAVTAKTKMLILNNPNNPLGKVYTMAELEQIAAFAERHNLIVLADEVYESLVYTDSPSPMIKFASLKGMFERTVTVGSIGKMFGVTGWKVGWAIGPKDLIDRVQAVHQYLVFSVATPLQEAAAMCIEGAMQDDYFSETRQTYQELRNVLFSSLTKAGFKPQKAHAGYFIVCTVDIDQMDGMDVCETLTVKAKVTGIPMGAFYCAQDAPERAKMVRFAFCKDRDTLIDADKRLQLYVLGSA